MHRLAAIVITEKHHKTKWEKVRVGLERGIKSVLAAALFILWVVLNDVVSGGN